MSQYATTSVALKRNGLPPCTERMQAVLVALRTAKEAGHPYVASAWFHGRTLRALEVRDWIAESLDKQRAPAYYITARGLKALEVYEQPTRYHYDGTCPTCEQRPRGHTSTGKLKPYCDRCQRQSDNAQYCLKGHQYKPDGLCPRCKLRPRHVYPSGFQSPYCLICRKALRKKERRAKVRRRLWLIRIGRPPVCLKCDQPVYHTAKTVFDYCYRHYREYQKAYWERTRRKQGVEMEASS